MGSPNDISVNYIPFTNIVAIELIRKYFSNQLFAVSFHLQQILWWSTTLIMHKIPFEYIQLLHSGNFCLVLKALIAKAYLFYHPILLNCCHKSNAEDSYSYEDAKSSRCKGKTTSTKSHCSSFFDHIMRREVSIESKRESRNQSSSNKKLEAPKPNTAKSAASPEAKMAASREKKYN